MCLHYEIVITIITSNDPEGLAKKLCLRGIDRRNIIYLQDVADLDIKKVIMAVNSTMGKTVSEAAQEAI